MNRSNPIFRLIISLVLLMLFQYALSFVLRFIGLTGVFYFIAFELILAFAFALFYYPYPGFKGRLKVAMKDPKFHKTFAIFFVVLVVMGLIF